MSESPNLGEMLILLPEDGRLVGVVFEFQQVMKRASRNREIWKISVCYPNRFIWSTGGTGSCWRSRKALSLRKSSPSGSVRGARCSAGGGGGLGKKKKALTLDGFPAPFNIATLLSHHRRLGEVPC